MWSKWIKGMRTMMIVRGKDIWTLAGWIVIPTNAGWRRDGSNVMGRGLALQAAQTHEGLARFYGAWLRTHPAEGVARYRPGRLILFPTKPRQDDEPWLSWRHPATITQIEKSCDELGRKLDSEWADIDTINMPLVGCGNGGLSQEAVMPTLVKFFGEDPRITLVLL